MRNKDELAFGDPGGQELEIREVSGRDDARWRAGPWRETMDQSMRMVIIAGVLMLALLVAIIGSVSADTITWQSAAANTPTLARPQL
jgi:hypothetical protein